MDSWYALRAALGVPPGYMVGVIAEGLRAASGILGTISCTRPGIDSWAVLGPCGDYGDDRWWEFRTGEEYRSFDLDQQPQVPEEWRG